MGAAIALLNRAGRVVSDRVVDVAVDDAVWFSRGANRAADDSTADGPRLTSMKGRADSSAPIRQFRVSS